MGEYKMKTKLIQATDMLLIEAGIMRFINMTEDIEIVNMSIATELTMDCDYPNMFHALIIYRINRADV